MVKACLGCILGSRATFRQGRRVIADLKIREEVAEGTILGKRVPTPRRYLRNRSVDLDYFDLILVDFC